jgi:predicted dienelactone hydrolase
LEVPMKRLAAILAIALTLPAVAQADLLPGYDRFDLGAAHRSRPVAGSIWYPAAGPTYQAQVGDGPIFEPTAAFMAPAVAEGKHPLILLSHGSGGNADQLGWLSSGLVAKGAIVLAVNHPGSTSGDSSARRSLDLAARANDLRAALDFVLADPDFAPFIDQNRIGVVGFSLGGTTALGLAGVRFDGKVQAERCSTGPDAADCGFFLRGGADFATTPGYSVDTRDPRISHAVAVDPGFGGSATDGSVSAITVPIHLVNLGDAPRLAAVDVGPNGNNLAGRIAGASYSVVAPANHFTFLAPCKPGAEEILREDGEDPICTDPAKTDRANTHERLIADIAAGLGL